MTCLATTLYPSSYDVVIIAYDIVPEHLESSPTMTDGGASDMPLTYVRSTCYADGHATHEATHGYTYRVV